MQTSQQNGAIQRPFRASKDWQGRKGFPEILILMSRLHNTGARQGFKLHLEYVS
jgi:hypothetical protein